jgi:outer membrane protein TolC
VEIQIPNSPIPAINKDQYRATLSVNQLIYAGGLINASINEKTAVLKTQQKQVEVSIYQLKQQINQLYFSILLLQAQKDLLTAKKDQLESKLKEVNSGILNGVLLPASNKVLEAELLKIKQQFSELNQNKLSLVQTLSALIGKKITINTVFENPEVSIDFKTEVTRPELELFQLKKTQIETSKTMLSKQNAPKLLGFATGGYGNPGLNFLDNTFQTFYTVGLKVNWNVFDWNANSKKRESLTINKDIIDNEEEIFKLNTAIALNKQQVEIDKILELIKADSEIITLRKDVLKSAASQLRNGVITTSAYITELTNLYEAENNMNRHHIELLLVKANYNVTKGQ